MAQVFISYSRKDIRFARRLAGDLEKANLDVWWDISDLKGGDDWVRFIPSAIEASQYFVVLLSPDSVQSEWVAKEYTYAITKRKKVVPAMIRQCSVPFALQQIKYVNFVTDEYATGLNRLLTALDLSSEVPAKQPNIFQRIFGGQTTAPEEALPEREDYVESSVPEATEPLQEEERVSFRSDEDKADTIGDSKEEPAKEEPELLKCYVISEEGLRLRSGPDSSYPVITLLKMNAELTILEDPVSALAKIRASEGVKIGEVDLSELKWINVRDSAGNEGYVVAIYVSLSPSELPPGYSPPIAGYISDRADQDKQDLLDISREVANIANVLTFKQVQPPLALGLFGDWGSGKTFFMGKLRRYINQIAGHYQQEEQVTGEEAMWCSRVAQIEFNAWHFSDSNLWASLVTRIYEGLDRELNKEKETADDIKKKIIEAQIEEAKEKSIKAESQLDLAKTRVNSAEENLEKKKKEREAKEGKLSEMIGSVPDLLKDTEFDQPLREATNALGVPEAAQTFEALEELDGQLKNLSGRLTAVTMSLLHSPKTLILMTLFVVFLPVLFTFAIERWGEILTDIGKRVAEISTFLLFIIGWLQAQARRGLGLVEKVEAALQKARNVRQTKIDTDKDVIEARKAFTDAQAEEFAARTNLEMAQTELQRLQNELQELRPERKLQRLIETRANSGAYAQHLGIISLIRSDFENMSRILSEMIDERRDFQKPPPIQRIILYIDDLDRCKPERVVEVLEAIHLLLFFPLFVVVVAVDPRWLRHSLIQHYPATLNESGGMVLLDDRMGISLYSTPQDYLEKIFQIPFALRPVERGGYQSLVDDLLKPLPPRKQQKAPDLPPLTRDESGEPGETITTGFDQTKPTEIAVGTTTDEHDLEPSIEREQQEEQAEIPESPAETSFTPIPPRQLEFTEWEKENIQQLWLMFRTPRTVKRFINIYRLLRAGLISDTELKNFEGTRRKPGDYQVALLLLATITAFPNEASQLLYRLDAWLDVQEKNKKRRVTNWSELIEYLKQEPEDSTQKILTNSKKYQKSEAKFEQTEGPKEKALDMELMDNNQTSESSWNLMLDCIRRVTQDSAWNKNFKITALRTWIMRVARFSFSVQPT